jgi:hypothetical protein
MADAIIAKPRLSEAECEALWWQIQALWDRISQMNCADESLGCFHRQLWRLVLIALAGRAERFYDEAGCDEY